MGIPLPGRLQTRGVWIRFGGALAVCALLGCGGVALTNSGGPTNGGGDDHDGPFTADAATSRLVLTLVGPKDEPMALYSADNNLGGTCFSLIFTKRPANMQKVAGNCLSREGLSEANQVPLNHSLSAGPDGGYAIMFAPGANRVVVNDGTTSRTFPAAEGMSAIWFPPNAAGRRLEFTSYDRAGKQLQQTSDGMPISSGPAQRR